MNVTDWTATPVCLKYQSISRTIKNTYRLGSHSTHNTFLDLFVFLAEENEGSC